MQHFAKICAISLAFTIGIALPSFAEDAKAKPFTDATEVNLLVLLPPPPANDSAQMRAELAEILTLQVTRTPEQSARAVADAEENVWRFADVIDSPKFTKENLPKFTAFFDRIVETEGAVTDPAKKVWNRPRPHLYSDLVHPVVPLSKSGSYPSGHTTIGTLMGIVLSNMLPEKKAALMARAWEYGHNRMVGGIHYATDIEAGRISGTVIASTIMTHDDYKTEFEAAKAELRTALGM
ncbi:MULTISPECIES: acid phosphatase [Rhizobium]|uniref:Acid phosphatase n=1 Tax=Rhizobium rhododendri TaxID=2506430 RepID=A0ABY8IJR7_9HYPH|nr:MULTISPECIES: phosphatase PAP2 family protein [Rhizobium]MBZ5759911.1 phosphatase PAP2 family protein [Rhizobium sp. VS19-DR96]MBZ5766608.1 phosphatase PAP2 family protein [Rhizobium sp. VS19-DR129.2]MBZ5776865.1 phosphatase PAP2 family protein [Rhizobium sp. VS19-DRK62.2]MBZ5787963.1 phosphatase PAP2 family protein [Rhizobium sp. VS19-DR121]MBZ5805431.1 phosphatase PAP2 family protein [Rhizobium sp. VS19-DR181]